MIYNQEKFIIWQYRNQPKALGAIRAILSETTNTFNSSFQIADILNIDTATGYALDLIGRHVGVSRVLNQAIAKEYFGFAESESSLGFDIGEFYRYGDSLNANVVLNDGDYRFFIKARVVKNYQTGTLKNIIESTRLLTGENSNVVDKLDMSMNIIVNGKSLSSIRLFAIKRLDILVRPIGVNYSFLLITNDKPFGFYADDLAYGFGIGQFTRLKTIGIQ